MIDLPSNEALERALALSGDPHPAASLHKLLLSENHAMWRTEIAFARYIEEQGKGEVVQADEIERVAAIIESSLERHGVDLSTVEGTRDDAQDIIAALHDHRLAAQPNTVASPGYEAGEVEQIALYRDIFAEITAKAEPLCEDRSDPDKVTGYRLPTGPLHRAAGKLSFQMFNGERHLTAAVERVRELEAGLAEELRTKLRMIVSHATGGQLSEEGDIDRSTNNISCEITRFRNRLYQDAKAAGLAEGRREVEQQIGTHLRALAARIGEGVTAKTLQNCADFYERGDYRPTTEARRFTPERIAAASVEVERLTRELDITNADHIALWLEANMHDSPLGWLACRIVEAHEAVLANPPRHRYWGAGEPDCPPDIKAGNGELHTLRCKVCGNEDARNQICRPTTEGEDGDE